MDESLIGQLLDSWEDEWLNGVTPDLERICAGHPDALPRLQERVQAFLRMNQLLADPLSPGQQPHDDHRAFNDSVSSAEPGTIITTEARYRILRPHAHGGLGEVLVAHDELLNRTVALKRISPGSDRDPLRRRRFLREAEITSQLDHPGIVSILSIRGSSDSGPCYAMKFITGGTLAEQTRIAHAECAAGGNDAGSFATHVLRPLITRFIAICNTVGYAHSQGFIHRDIKPANLMLGDFGATYVVDWGLARRFSTGTERNPDASAPPVASPTCQTDTVAAADSGTAEPGAAEAESLTRTGVVMGTPAFMSPEQSEGNTARIGPASDIYSLGATLYYILTGQTALTIEDNPRWFEQLQTGRFRRPSELRRGIPKPLEAVCLKAMSLRPADRYSSAVALAEDLEHWLADLPVSAMPETFSEKLARLTRRHRAWTQSIAAALILITLTASVFAVLLNKQKNIAQTAESNALVLAEQKSELAQREVAARKIADEQNKLSLATLRSVVFSISRRLQNVSGASDVRTALLKTSIDGLTRVARTLDNRVEVDRNLATAHNDIGAIYLLAGSMEGTDATAEALRQFLRAQEITMALAVKEPQDPVLQRDLSISYEKIGDVQMQRGEVSLAEEAYLQSLKISEIQLQRSPEDYNLRRDVAFGFEKVGDIRQSRNETGAARESFTRAHEYYTRNVAERPTDAMLQRDLVVARSKLGNVLRQEGRLDDAAAMFRQCIESCAALEQIPDSESQRRDRSLMFNKLGSVLQEQGDLSAAADAYQQGLVIAREIVAADPSDAGAQRDLSISLNYLGELCTARNEFELARTHLTDSLTIRRKLATSDASSQVAQTAVAQSLLKLGELELKAGQTEVAKTLFAEGLRILEPLQQANKLQTAADQELLKALQKASVME